MTSLPKNGATGDDLSIVQLTADSPNEPGSHADHARETLTGRTDIQGDCWSAWQATTRSTPRFALDLGGGEEDDDRSLCFVHPHEALHIVQDRRNNYCFHDSYRYTRRHAHFRHRPYSPNRLGGGRFGRESRRIELIAAVWRKPDSVRSSTYKWQGRPRERKRPWLVSLVGSETIHLSDTNREDNFRCHRGSILLSRRESPL